VKQNIWMSGFQASVVRQESWSNHDTPAYNCKLFDNWPVSVTGGNEVSMPVLEEKYSAKLSLEETGDTCL